MTEDLLLTTSWQKEGVKWSCQLGAALEKKGYRVHVFSPLKGAVDGSMISGEAYYPNSDDTRSLPTAQYLESEYPIPSVRHLYFTDMKYFALSRAEALERTRRFAAALRAPFEQYEIDYVFQGRGGEVHRLLAHYFASDSDGTCVWGEFSPFEGRMAFSTRLNGTWDAYSTVPNDEIPAGEKESVQEYIESYREEQRVYTHGADSESSRDVYETVAEMVDNLRTIALGRTPNNPVRFGARKVRHRINERINYKLLKSLKESRESISEQRYVFLPLQYPIESRLTVFSPEFFDQSFIIDYVARLLPEDISLFVKQHPNHPGCNSPLWLYKQGRRDGVEFLHPSINSHESIENAEATIVTNNTVGFEALFYHTPVVVLGRAFYEGAPGALSVNMLSSLPDVLSRAIKQRVSDETIRSSIYSLKQSTYAREQFGDLERTEKELEAEETADGLVAFLADHGFHKEDRE